MTFVLYKNSYTTSYLQILSQIFCKYTNLKVAIDIIKLSSNCLLKKSKKTKS